MKESKATVTTVLEDGQHVKLYSPSAELNLEADLRRISDLEHLHAERSPKNKVNQRLKSNQIRSTSKILTHLLLCTSSRPSVTPFSNKSD